MLIVNYVIDTLPMKRQKNEDFDECSQVRSTIEKNGRREKIFQNKFVSSRNRRNKKRRGRHGRFVGHFVTYLFPAADATVVRKRAVRQSTETPNALGKLHKIPFISDYRVVASTKFSDI
jgi:hypothetical protein